MCENDVQSPLVSIIIPVYNGSNYLKEAIDSALSQTYENLEIIVVNDGSTDNTREIALSFGERIRYFEKKNGGVSSALNIGIREMKGEYFSWLSHDDKYFPNKIKSQIESLSSVDNIGNTVCLCDTCQIDKNGIVIKKQKRSKSKSAFLQANAALNFLIDEGCFNGCSLLIPKTVFEKVGLFDERLRFCQDFLMWINIFCAGYSLLCIQMVGVMSRVHSRQLTQTGQDLFHKDSLVLCKECLAQIYENSSKKCNCLYSFALYNAKYNNVDSLLLIKKKASDEKMFSFGQRIVIGCYYCYGKIRPLIRKIYHKILKRTV